MADPKTELVESLAKLNDAVLSKLEGLGEYNLRRPLTPTGTNLLGVVKHLASVQAEYFGDVFGRDWPNPMPWFSDGAEVNDDLFAAASETSEWVLGFYRASWAHATETFDVTDLDDVGTVSWWPEDRRHPSLRTVLLHMTVETARHAGHIDIVRELIDGAAGRFAGDASIPGDDFDWPRYIAKIEEAATLASGAEGDPTADDSPERHDS